MEPTWRGVAMWLLGLFRRCGCTGRVRKTPSGAGSCQTTSEEQADGDMTDPSTRLPTFCLKAIKAITYSGETRLKVDGCQVSPMAGFRMSPDRFIRDIPQKTRPANTASPFAVQQWWSASALPTGPHYGLRLSRGPTFATVTVR